MSRPANPARKPRYVADGPDKGFWIPAPFLFEKGMIRLNEPGDADVEGLLLSLVGGDYGKPFVIEDGVTRKLHFSVAFTQSEMLIANPDLLQLAYTRAMAAFLLFVPAPERVTIVGLGGGSLTKFCYRHLPQAHIITVEIDPEVLAFAPLFAVPDDPARCPVIEADAIDYLAASEALSDVILLDGCDQHGVAPGFLEDWFYPTLRARLTPGGVMVMNLVGSSDDYRRHLALINQAFEGRTLVLHARADGNCLAFAFNDPAFDPDWRAIETAAATLGAAVGFDLVAFARKLAWSDKRLRVGRRKPKPAA